MSYDVQVKSLTVQPILSIRALVPHDTVMQFYDDSQTALHAYAQQIGVPITGPQMSLWYSGPHDSPTHTDIETAIPIAHLVSSQEPIQARELPAGRVVSTIHYGRYDTLGDAFTAVWNYIEAQHATAAGPPRDLVLIGPNDTTDPTAYQTEVAWPIA